MDEKVDISADMKVDMVADMKVYMQTSLKWDSTIAVLSGTLAPAGTFLKNTDKICAAD